MISNCPSAGTYRALRSGPWPVLFVILGISLLTSCYVLGRYVEETPCPNPLVKTTLCPTGLDDWAWRKSDGFVDNYLIFPMSNVEKLKLITDLEGVASVGVLPCVAVGASLILVRRGIPALLWPLLAAVSAFCMTQVLIKPNLERYLKGVRSYPSGRTTYMFAELAILSIVALSLGRGWRFIGTMWFLAGFPISFVVLVYLDYTSHYLTDFIGGALVGVGSTISAFGLISLVSQAFGKVRDLQRLPSTSGGVAADARWSRRRVAS